METRWLYVTSEELPKLREASMDTCIIPMGCIEKHGLHMPLGTDILKGSRIAYEASKLETVCVFPDYIYGDVPEMHSNMPKGTMTITTETMMKVLEELCEQIARNGFKKILVFNSHGGNQWWLNLFMRKLANKKRNFVFAHTILPDIAPHIIAEKILREGKESLYELNDEDVALILKYHEEDMITGHACMYECACMMGFAPESVHLDRLGIESGLSNHKADYLREAGIFIKDGGWGINTPYAFSGDDPVGCNERIGKATIRVAAEMLAKRIKLMKEDENLLKWHEEFQAGWSDDEDVPVLRNC